MSIKSENPEVNASESTKTAKVEVTEKLGDLDSISLSVQVDPPKRQIEESATPFALETDQTANPDDDDDDDDDLKEDNFLDGDDEDEKQEGKKPDEDDKKEQESITTENFFGAYDQATLNFSDDESAISTEEKMSIKKCQAPAIDRQMYYQMYKVVEREYRNSKMKNNYLQKKLVDYYRRRKMEHVFKDSVDLGSGDPLRKRYEKVLDAFEELCDSSHREQSRIRNDIDVLTWKRDHKRTEVENKFIKLQQLETDVGNEIEKANSSDKFFERYLKRQKSQFNYTIKLRREYINLKNKYQEKLEALNALDHLGPGMHLSDFEQLKVDNRNHKDKLEEKENELTKLRYKCQNNIQILAHRREKVAAVDTDIERKKYLLESVMIDYEDAREHLANIKIEKVRIRGEIIKLHDDAGLLTQPTLLMDMQNASEEIKEVAEKVNQYKEDYTNASERIKEVRKEMFRCKALHAGGSIKHDDSNSSINNSSRAASN